jgi:outer membrane protein assembly factor BamB
MKPALFAVAAAMTCQVWAAASLAGEPVGGWRGNRTGLWPEGHPPLVWQRIAKGAMEGLRCRADKPAGADAGDAPLVEKGLPRDWLVLGPFAVAESEKDFDRDPLGGETTVEPAEGDKVADRSWQRATVPPDDFMVFGTAELPWLDLAKAVGFQRNQIAYAHTYLHSPRGGKAQIVVDHGEGLKAWVNGKEVYRSPQRKIALGFYTAISRHELDHLRQSSAKFDVDLKPGWNRLLIKLSSPSREGYTDMRCCLRVMDPPDVPYESKNIRWMTELPARSTSTPIIVTGRIFVMAEPDELLCIDKESGGILWTASHSYYDALTDEERKGLPALEQQVAPLIAELKQERDRTRRIELRAKIQEALLAIDKKQFEFLGNDHFSAHFGIVGFTMSTPISDGQHVYIWCGNGVAACYDLDGHRQWITRVSAGELTYASSPALAAGVLVVFLNHLYGLDARTGKLLWEQPKVHKNVASLLPARLSGKEVVVTQQGEVINPADGELLFRPRGQTSGDTGWSPPVVLGETMYFPKYGVAQLNLFDFTNAAADEWKPKEVASIGMPGEINRGPNGQWLDRWTAGSPLIHENLAYVVDMYAVLYVLDLDAKKLVSRQQLDLRGFTHYNALAVAASPTLVGKHLLLLDNQGTTLVFELGPIPKLVGRNEIQTQLDRAWPVPAQETLAYAPPIVDGNRLYLRGERYLYCIGER